MMNGGSSRKRNYTGIESDSSRISYQADKLTSLRSVLGEDIEESRLQQLLAQNNGDLDLAANAYFSNPQPTTSSTSTPMDIEPTPKLFFSTNQKQKLKEQPSPRIPVISATNSRHRFYIGDTVVTGWATFTGSSPLQPGDKVVIDRNKPFKATKTNKRNRTQISKHTIVRFTTLSGSEVGRFPRSTAKFVSTLMDQEVCDFEATIVWCDNVLKTGDDILLHMKCYLRKSALGTPNIISAKTLTIPSSFSNVKKSSLVNADNESFTRDRTLALLSLIRTLGLRPTRSVVQHEKFGNNNTDTDNDIFDQISHSIMTTTTELVDSKVAAGNEDDDDDDDDNGEKELTDGQLDNIYEKAQVFDAQIKPMEQPDTLALNLKPYQQRALAWMVAKESIEYNKDEVDVRSMHPLWEEYRFPKDPDGTCGEIGSTLFYFNPYNGELDTTFPETNTQERGGILADEMGLGKTIEMLSLIHTNRHTGGPLKEKNSSPTTLIVCPMALLAQWRNEVTRGSIPGSMTVEVFYNEAKKQELRQMLCSDSAPDVLVTTYGVVVSEFGRLEGNKRGGSSLNLFDVDFWRVVLDEAHHIKNRQSLKAKACHSIKSTRRWALTGTPIQNKMEDLFSLVRFLKCEPWGNYTFWRTFITVPFERKDSRAISTVKSVLEPLVLRRTKNMRDKNGDHMVPLPSKQVNIEYLDFSGPEQDIYDSLFNDSRTKFSHFCSAGTNLRGARSIFQLLSRLRQATCHPYLALRPSKSDTSPSDGGDGTAALNSDILTDGGGRISIETLIESYQNSPMANISSGAEGNGGNLDVDGDETMADRSYGVTVLTKLLHQQRGESAASTDQSLPDECPICFEPVESVIMLPCMHMGCRPCILEYLQKKERYNLPGDCPICRHGPIVEADLLEIVKKDNSNVESNAILDVRRAVGGYKSSTKIDALIRHLKQYINEGRRTVVFSQYTGFLDLIQVALNLHDIGFVRFDGSLSQAQREKVIAKFTAKDSDKSTSNAPMVMLISLMAGGVGLNLTCASRAIMMDPWWNFAVEAQAIDRVHRMGQEDDVVVTRFIIKGTVEEQILEIQNRKHVMMNELYKSKEEKKAEHMQDLQRIFGVGTRDGH